MWWFRKAEDSEAGKRKGASDKGSNACILEPGEQTWQLGFVRREGVQGTRGGAVYGRGHACLPQFLEHEVGFADGVVLLFEALPLGRRLLHR